MLPVVAALGTGVFWRSVCPSYKADFKVEIRLPMAVSISPQETCFIYTGLRNPEVDFGLIRSAKFGWWDAFFSTPGQQIVTFPLHLPAGAVAVLGVHCHAKSIECGIEARTGFSRTFPLHFWGKRHQFKSVVSIAGKLHRGSSIQALVDGQTVNLRVR